MTVDNSSSSLDRFRSFGALFGLQLCNLEQLEDGLFNAVEVARKKFEANGSNLTGHIEYKRSLEVLASSSLSRQSRRISGFVRKLRALSRGASIFERYNPILKEVPYGHTVRK
jgi:hypothetical protein